MPTDSSMLPGDFHYDLEGGIEDADVEICLRLQRERMLDGGISSTGEYASLYQINSDSLRMAKPDCVVMHPGPINRGIEVDDATADGPNSAINAQVENGVFVRMAAFYWCFGGNAA